MHDYWLFSTDWHLDLIVLLVAIGAKGSLSFCEASAKRERSNGEKERPHPKVFESLRSDSSGKDVFGLGSACLGIIVSVLGFIFLWNSVYYLWSPLDADLWVRLGGGLALLGLTALIQHLITVSLPSLFAQKASPEAWRGLTWVVLLVTWSTYPIRWVVMLGEWTARRLLGLGKTVQQEQNLQAEIEALGNSSGEKLSSGIREIVGNTLQLRNLDAQDILLPRHLVQVLEVNDPLSKNLELVNASGHTRFPLCNRDLDHCVGIVHVKDVFREMAENKDVDLDKIKRDFATFSPEDPLAEVLQKMLKSRLHMALVRDEFGGAIGVITLEDALEEVVGEIKDEFDAGEEELIQPRMDGTYQVAGLAQTHEVAEALGIRCGNDEISTFGGWITMALGRIPKQNESFVLGDLEITVEKADGVRVIITAVKPLHDKSATGSQAT